MQFRIYQDFTDVMKEKVCVFAMAELLTEASTASKPHSSSHKFTCFNRSSPTMRGFVL